MLRTIKLKGLTGRFTTPSFPWTQNEPLVVKFDVAEERSGRYFLIVRCGNMVMEKHCLPKDLTVEITPDFIKQGNYNPVEFLLEYRNPFADKVIIGNDPKKNGFFIEPLYITRVEGNTTGIAWLQKIEQEIALLKETVTAHGIKLDELPTLIKNAQNAAVLEATGYDPLNG